MLREEQIDLRRQRARTGRFQIENTGRKKVFSAYRVTNPESGGQYTVTIRGFDTGDNACTCPDFKANTLGTCKHILAVIESLAPELPPHTRKKKAPVVAPEIYLHYGEQLQLGLHLPARYSDKLGQLARRFFDERGFWSGRGKYEELIPAVERVPEEVTVLSDALDFIDREMESAMMRLKERDWLADLEAGRWEPSLLLHPLYPYQQRGAIFLACRGRAILGDDMGLGKTVQTLAAVELLARERGISRVLVVAPTGVKYHWLAEIRKFTQRHVQVIEDHADEHETSYERPTFYRLVSYEQAERDRDAINDWKPDLIVLDEAQRIKNWESRTSRGVKKLQSRYAFVLTGTPIENSLEELYSIVQFVDERRFGPAFQFLHDHRVLNRAGEFVGYRNLETIREKLEPILLRRTRGEVLAQLPPRTESTIMVELGEPLRGPYEEQRLSLSRLLDKPHLTGLDRTRILAGLTTMRMICNGLHPAESSKNASAKLSEFHHLAFELTEKTEQKLVVFSQWEPMLEQAANVLDRLDITHVMLNSELTGPDRRKAADMFLKQPDCRVLLCTDDAGTGLNLHAADTVIHWELPWNSAVLEQRIARVLRPGQIQPVRVIQFVTRGTMEENIQSASPAQRGLYASLFDSSDDDFPPSPASRRQFVDAVREVVSGRPSQTASEDRTAPGWDASLRMIEPTFESAVTLLEALASWLKQPEVQTRLSDDLQRRLAQVLR